MASIYRLFITGVVVTDDQDPAHWEMETLVREMHGISVESKPLEEKVEWPQKPRKKRSYTCSICGGRHSARFCPQRRGHGSS